MDGWGILAAGAAFIIFDGLMHWRSEKAWQKLGDALEDHNRSHSGQ